MTREEVRAMYPDASEEFIDQMTALYGSTVTQENVRTDGTAADQPVWARSQGEAAGAALDALGDKGLTQADLDKMSDGSNKAFRRGRRKDRQARDAEIRDALFGQQTDQQRAMAWLNPDGSLNGDSLDQAYQDMVNVYIGGGYSPDDAVNLAERNLEKLYDQVANWQRSPEGQTALSFMREEAMYNEKFPQMQAELRQGFSQALDDYKRGESAYKGAASTGMSGVDFVDRMTAAGSAGRGVVGDEQAYQNRISALGNLMDVYKTEGMTEADKAAMELARQGAMQASRASREAAAAQAAREGRGGGGMDYMMRMQARQQGSGDAARAMMQNQIAARQRAVEALQNAQQGYGQAFNDRTSQQAQRSQLIDDFNKAMTQERGTMLRDVTESQRGAGDAAQATGEARTGMARDVYSAGGDEVSARAGLETQKRGVQGTERAAEIAKEQQQQQIGLNTPYGGVNYQG